MDPIQTKNSGEDQLVHAGERVDQLYAAGIKVIQSKTVFSFSLDAVLLAHFANPTMKKSGLVVDLCAGNGAVGLFLTAKTNAKIIGVEIQPKLADMAKRSVELNKLSDQVQILNLDLKEAKTKIKADSVDTITVNPPYFESQATSKKNPNQYLAIARHELCVTLDQVLVEASRELKMGGKLYMVHRPDRLAEIFAKMEAHRLAPKKVQLVYPRRAKEANMVLVEAIKDGKRGGQRFLPPIIAYGDGLEYSQEIKDILNGKNGKEQ